MTKPALIETKECPTDSIHRRFIYKEHTSTYSQGTDPIHTSYSQTLDYKKIFDSMTKPALINTRMSHPAHSFKHSMHRCFFNSGHTSTYSHGTDPRVALGALLNLFTDGVWTKSRRAYTDRELILFTLRIHRRSTTRRSSIRWPSSSLLHIWKHLRPLQLPIHPSKTHL